MERVALYETGTYAAALLQDMGSERLARYKLLSFACFAGLLAAGGADAREHRGDPRHSWFAAGSLILGTRTLALDYDDSAAGIDLDTEFIGVVLEDRLDEHLRGGVTLARVFLSQSGRTATRGMSPGGAVLGLHMSWRPPLGKHLGLLAESAYSYNDAGGSTDAQNTDISWHSLAVRGGVSVRAGRFTLSGGGVYRSVDGRERTFGDVDETTSFAMQSRGGTFLDLEVNTDPGGYVGLRLEAGAAEQVLFFFQRNF